MEEDLMSLSDDQKIEKINSEGIIGYVRTELAMSLQSDELKLQVIDKTPYFGDKNKIIKSLKSDEAKIQALSLTDDESLKSDIILTLQSDKSKLEAMEQHISSEMQRTKIISGFSSIENKLACLNLVQNSFYKRRNIRKHCNCK